MQIHIQERFRLLMRLFGWLLVVGSLVWMYQGTLVGHMRWSATPGVLNDDTVQQVAPFYRYEDPELFPSDYCGDYFLACLPWGYRGLYTLAGRLDAVDELSRSLPYVELLIVVVCVAMTVQPFGGRTGVWLALMLCLGSDLMLTHVVGGLPRSFGMPCVAMALVALVHGRMRLLAVLVPFTAAFYPAAAMPMGLTLVLVLWVLPASDRGSAIGWTRRTRIMVVALAALSAGAVLAPTVWSARQYGSVITPPQVETYPEIGAEGRYNAISRAPFPLFMDEVSANFNRAIVGSGKAWLSKRPEWVNEGNGRRVLCSAIQVLALVGWLGYAFRRSDARRVWMLALAACVGYHLACPLAPYLYLPQRYVAYPIPLLTLLMVATCAGGYLAFFRIPTGNRFVQPVLISVLGTFLLLTVGGRGDSQVGMQMLSKQNRQALSELARLPKDALLAGWPFGLMDYTPQISRRQVLLSFELHQAFHVDYTIEMRRRMKALTDAYYATSLEPIRALSRDFGVTHLVVDLRLYTSPPVYFQPFTDYISDAWEAGKGNYELKRQLDRGTRIRTHVVLLDIRTL